MTKRKVNRTIAEYAMKYYNGEYGLCTLCGNHGVIHTEGTRAASGLTVGRANFCICFNGQMLRNSGVDVLEVDNFNNRHILRRMNDE